MIDKQAIQSHLFQTPGRLGEALEVALDDGQQQTPLGDNHKPIKDAICGMLSYYRQTGKRINGHKYASDKLHSDPQARIALALAIREHFHQRTGLAMKIAYPTITDARLLWNWIITRKKNYKPLRDGEAIGGWQGQQSLLDDEVSAVVYAYYGIANGVSGVIKLGYTEQVLEKYLRSKELSHKPVLLASMPGTKQTESECHSYCKQDNVIGNEWFAPTDRVQAFVRTRFKDLEVQFDQLFANARYQYYGQ